MRIRTAQLILGTLAVALTGAVQAQAANAGADFNKAERANAQESQRTAKIDRPVQPDVPANALIGGAATGTIRGAGAGAVSAVRSGAVGTAVQAAKERAAQAKATNKESGRGGSSDPRYDPRTLFRK